MLAERSVLRLRLATWGADPRCLPPRRIQEWAWRLAGVALCFLATLLLLAQDGCAEQAIVVPKDALPTTEIRNEHIEIDAAAPFFEHVELREARLSYPFLYGTFVALTSSRTYVRDAQVKFPMLDPAQVSPLRLLPDPADGTLPPSDGTVGIRVHGAVPLGGYLDLRAPRYKVGQASGTIEAVQPPAVNWVPGHRIGLDVRRLDRLAIYRQTETSTAAIILVSVLVPLGLTIGITAALIDSYCRQHSPCNFLSVRVG